MSIRFQCHLFMLCLLTAALGYTMQGNEKWLGTWKMNPAKSKFSPGPAPKEWTLKFEKSDGGIKLTSSGITAKGEKQSMTFTAPFDGSEVKWSGNPDADTCAPLKMNDGAYVNAVKKGGKLILVVKAQVAADGKTLTIIQTGITDNVVIYEHQ